MSILEVFRGNPGEPFIIAFILMLLSAAVALALNCELLANKLAEVAYYFLVIGVILQLIALVKESRNGK